MPKRRISLLVLLCILVFAGKVHAAITVSTTAVAFGAYDPLGTSNDDSTGNIQIRCTGGTNYVVTTSIGVSPNSGGFNPRQMKATDLLNYNLYRNSSRTQIWGDGTQGTYTSGPTSCRNTTLNLTIYGRIPPGQDVGIGSYTETLVVTISY